MLFQKDREELIMKYKCASFFAGVGGIDLGFEKAGFKTVYANEINPNAAHTYEQNFNIKVDLNDIKKVAEELENNPNYFEDVDIFLAGFPCQAFSVAGNREGFSDSKGRGNLFFELMRIVRIKKPDFIFLENVKNLMGHDNGNTYRIIESTLSKEGYHVTSKVFNSMNYGNVPQNRERIYILASKDKKVTEKLEWIKEIQLTNTLDKVLDFNSKLDDKFYYTENKYNNYNELKKCIVEKNTVYQWRRIYVRKNNSNVCPTLTANMGTGGHNVPLILTDYGIRKLTPRECFKLQGFPNDFILPNDLALSHLYKQAGNSVTVTVIERLATMIKKALLKKNK